MDDFCGCVGETACEMVYDSDTWDDWGEEDRETEKEERCCECSEPIPPGTLASFGWGGKWSYDEDGYEVEDEDGDYVMDQDTLEEGWTCTPCKRIRDDLYAGCVMFGQMRELIYECMGFDYVTGEP